MNIHWSFFIHVWSSISVCRILPRFNLHPCRCATFHTKRQLYFITFDRIKVGIFFFSFRSYYHPLILPRNLNKLVERSTPPFFFSIRSQESSYQPFTPYQFKKILHTVLHNVLRCWRGEFVSQSRASIVAYHFLSLVYDSGVIL